MTTMAQDATTTYRGYTICLRDEGDGTFFLHVLTPLGNTIMTPGPFFSSDDVAMREAKYAIDQDLYDPHG